MNSPYSVAQADRDSNRNHPASRLLRLAGRLPWRLQGMVMSQVLSAAFAQNLQAHELAFLEDRVVEIHVRDLDLRWRLSARARRIVAVGPDVAPDTTFRGDASALVALANRRADPDTLFFQRRLLIEGDTELGLHLKNWLDTLEPEQLPAPVRVALSAAERLFPLP
jgi:predicted lipid carrier protein YhbT